MCKYHLLILCASTYLNGCSQGLTYSLGAYFVDWSETFHSTKAETAWALSINLALLFMMGPVAGALCLRFGIQATAVLGSVIAALGLVSSAYSTNIYHMCITFGAIAGTGFGLMLVSCLSSVGEHFAAHRTLALGLVAVGGGMCLLVFPYLHRVLIDLFTWRAAHIIVASLVLQGAIMGALLRPPEGAIKTRNVKDCKQQGAAKPSMNWLQMFTLCKDTRLVLFMCGNFFLAFGGNTLPALIIDYAVDQGSSKTAGTRLLSMVGLGSFLGRLAVIPLLMARKTREKVMYIFLFGGILRSMGTLLCPTTSSIVVLSGLAACYGMGLGIQICVGAPCMPVVFGTANMPYYFGFFFWSLGMGSMFGSPAAGWLFRLEDSYSLPLYISGSISLLSGLFLVAVLYIPAAKDPALLEMEPIEIKSNECNRATESCT